MSQFRIVAIVFALIVSALGVPAGAEKSASPLSIGETFTIDSKILRETRRINVYLPPAYAESPSARLPVLYMPDGGMAEDFLHVAGLVQVGAGNGTMRPFLLVGIENTERRRDMTGPTENPEDKKIAPRVGGSAAFRAFLRQELIPQVKARYRTSNETAIVGESLAGLFVVETFLLEPELFDTYIAFDPSLWWNNKKLVNDAAKLLRDRPKLKKTLYFASSDEPGIIETAERLADILAKTAPPGLHLQYVKMPEETHGTIYHPAALKAFRALFRPKPSEGREAAGAKDVAPTFCLDTYALCIEAACSPIATRGPDGHRVDGALCTCDVVHGWSMGPVSCEERAKKVQGTKTFLTSAFSNLYSERSRVLSCPSPSQEWAYCYGAQCVVDPRDPKKALCDCQVKTGPAKTLGGNCQPPAGSQLWVAATPAADEFAGPYFYESMRKDHPEVTVNPPAKVCPGGPGSLER